VKDPLQPERCARTLAALASPERLKIVRFLAGGPRHVAEVAEMLGVPPVNVCHHMNVLKRAALARGRKSGRFVFYSLSPGLLDGGTGAAPPLEVLDLGCCRLVLPAGEDGQATCPPEAEA
jgi:DNA-binding transcriptional ArsR family regulator